MIDHSKYMNTNQALIKRKGHMTVELSWLLSNLVNYGNLEKIVLITKIMGWRYLEKSSNPQLASNGVTKTIWRVLL